MQESTVGVWAEGGRLSGEALGALFDLNQRFLDLLTQAHDGDRHLGLAPGVIAAIGALPPGQRAALAACPYALFDIRFTDDGFWRERLSGAWQWRIADQADQPEIREFAGLCLFYAWHVAARDVEQSQLQLGMSGDTVAAFRRIKLNELSLLADQESDRLRARWHQYPSFWDALLGAASSADRRALRRTQLYGLQLTAAARLS